MLSASLIEIGYASKYWKSTFSYSVEEEEEEEEKRLPWSNVRWAVASSLGGPT